MIGSNNQGVVKVRHPLLILEDALVLCQFGRFHMRLLLASFASIYASTLITSTSSYLLPNAECDLNMTIMKKGLLNTAPFLGFVSSTLLSCFFVDVFGRKVFLVAGHLAVFIFTVLEASSQNYWSLLLMKVLEGALLILCIVSMLLLNAEFTHKGLRNRIGMIVVSFAPLALIGGALVSWGLLPHQDWHFIIWKGYFELHAWNIYLYVCSLFSLIAAMLFCTIPESPRYLLFQGKEAKALEILRNVYSENTGNDMELFPIKTLGSLGITPTNRISIRTWIKKYLRVLTQLFQKPVVYQIMLFSSLSFVSHLIHSTISLWYPQLSTIIEEYRNTHGYTDRFCTMLNHYTDSLNKGMGNLTVSEVCISTPSSSETYVNVIFVSTIGFFATCTTGLLVNYVRPKLLMFTLFLLCAVACGVLYVVSSSHQIALLIAAICGLLRASMGLQKIALTNLFPTHLRALGLSVIILCSKVGSLIGNILFPVLLQIDCMVPFQTFSVLILCASTLIYFIPGKKRNVS